MPRGFVWVVTVLVVVSSLGCFVCLVVVVGVDGRGSGIVDIRGGLLFCHCEL